ncbi:metalloregulator ArsR/SmtB family transcription factor [Maritimibacter sp. UBA3975]|uniref:ArsR/SmtB family transcription factor n=1 Tax=Maritimibacter sp. UBA3975 TaxID=1946833 RepID=UPI000C0AF2DB|nr:metalloregulator ArsR/SmtB family transcription factor [Maritimibacter sp. UBA3975]MAM62102.1 transcriptional regulator [Maritimibacter sp.]|tara:strand:+ start:3096 stop:3416 length:321 start_codon:yes stop_codon:yes gene_type:complete
MTPALAAAGFAAIGSEHRLDVLKTLVRAGEDGLNIAAIQERTGIAQSTLAHHLKSLVGGGLVSQEKRGRETINRAEYEQLRLLAAYILEACCADAPLATRNAEDAA